MPRRLLFLAGTLTAALVLAVLSHQPLLAQAGPSPYAAPRTPWGDPDLQGNYTNLWEAGTPFERPDQFAGRNLEDIKGEELATIRRGIQERRSAAHGGSGSTATITRRAASPGSLSIQRMARSLH